MTQPFPTNPNKDRDVKATGFIQRTIDGRTYQIRGTEEQLATALKGERA